MKGFENKAKGMLIFSQTGLSYAKNAPQLYSATVLA